MEIVTRFWGLRLQAELLDGDQLLGLPAQEELEQREARDLSAMFWWFGMLGLEF